MDLKDIQTKCYILALFIRDDGERFLLGSGFYEFNKKQLHFSPNSIANDIVEVQGNDGYLLAGQVKRPGSQSFDGYVGDGTVDKSTIEERRRDFLQFFRKNYFYKVVYIFPDGTAIQRKRGFLVDDPTVKELYQQYPEYHVALNFEDANYYSYAEDDEGEEIYTKEALVYLSAGVTSGGLVWDGVGVVWDDKNKVKFSNGGYSGVTGKVNPDGSLTISGQATSSGGYAVMRALFDLPAGTYTFSISKPLPFLVNLSLASGVAFRIPAGETSATTTLTEGYSSCSLFMAMASGTEYNETFNAQLVVGDTPDYSFVPNCAVWEEGGGGGPTVVEVDSIDTVYPIWEVKGPVNNPQLSVLSTNTTIHYDGTVTDSQTLRIDMFNKTATLNGTSVVGNVYGDWVNFAPGNNRVVYTADNSDAPPSRIEWQEVVG